MVALPAFFSIAALASCVGSGSAEAEVAPDVTNAEEVVAVEEVLTQAQPVPAPAPNLEFFYSGELTQGGFIRGTAPDGAVSAQLGETSLQLAADGSFFAAFDRDSSSSVTLAAILPNGRSINEQITVSPREWRIQHVNVAKRPGGSSEAWWARREPEWLAIKEAREIDSGSSGWSQQFIWPVKGRISGHFGRQRIYRGEPGSYHSGIDIAPGNGVPFVAPADGVVVMARTGFSLEGNIIIIDHGQGLNSAFLHASRIVVEEGQAVRQGQHIGNVGSTGRSTGPHLHWSLKWRDARLDPLLFTGPMN